MKQKLLQRNQGAVLLARTGQTQEEIAARIHVSRSLVSHWLTGLRTPTASNRVALRAAYGIPLDVWDAAVATVQTSAKSKKPKPPPPEAHVDHDEPVDVSVHAYAVDLTMSVRKALRTIQSGAGEPDWVLKQTKTATSQLHLLGKLTGETQEISEARIVRLPAWRRVMVTIERALAPYPPQALRDVGEALQALGLED